MINNNNKRKFSKRIDTLIFYFFCLVFFVAFDIGIFHHSILIAEYITIGGLITSAILIKFKKNKLPKSKHLPYIFLIEMLLLLTFD
ncbi:hypothetical protein ACLIKE_06840, partial [Ferroplasma acidiphilum]|uniref:hypothetical protein n=1 Tax=Ferroplasma acidiphilum TaxID=74969 RepID=UPI001F2312D9